MSQNRNGENQNDVVISFVVAVYNNEAYLENSVKSITKYKGDEIEVIIVDDGSTDNTPKLVDQIANRDHRIKAVHQQNQWIYASFNNGIKVASGEYIFILNSDDQLVEDGVQILLNAVKKYNHPDVIWNRVVDYFVDEKQNILGVSQSDLQFETDLFYPNVNDDTSVLLIPFYSKLIVNQGNLYKRELCVKYPFKNDYYNGDNVFNLVIMPHINSMAILKDTIYKFYIYRTGRNTSIQCWKGYEHEMYNSWYVSAKEMLCEIGQLTQESIEHIKKVRKGYFTSEIRCLLFYSPMNIKEKLKMIFDKFIDEQILDVLEEREELEARILSGIREYCVQNIGRRNITEELGFAYDLVNILSKYEKTADDMEKLKRAVYNEDNPHCIGETFYNRLI